MLSACGITAKSLELLLLSCDNDTRNVEKEVAISADIKTISNDFVVVEVDTDGQRTDDITHYTFVKESKVDTDVKSAKSKVAKTVTKEQEEQCNRSITERQNDIVKNIKIIVDEHKTEVECVVGSTNDILHKANAMALHEVQELLQEIMPHSQSTYELYNNNQNNDNTMNNPVCSSDKWWNKTTAFTFPLEVIISGTTSNVSMNSYITTCSSKNTKIDKEIRRMFYTIMRQRFPLLRTHLIESINDGDANTTESNNTSSINKTFERVAEMSSLQKVKEEQQLSLEDCNEQDNIKQPQVTVKVSLTIDLHLIFVAWLCGQNVALWLSSCINSESFQSVSLDRINSGNSDNANEGKRPNTIVFSFRDVDHCSGDSVTVTSKEIRRNFHNVLRRYYSYIQCKVRNGKVELQLVSQPRKRSRSNSEWENNLNLSRNHHFNDNIQCELSNNVNKYAYLIVKKENMETAEMKMVLADYFGIHEHYICTAGLKDKVAITYQRCSIPLHVKVYDNNINTYISVEDTLRQMVKGTLPFVIPWPSSPSISSVTNNGGKKCEIVKCSFPSVVYTSPIEVGDLHGNYFEIVLRNIEMHEANHSITSNKCDSIDTCADDLSNISEYSIDRIQSILSERARYLTVHGFINYFGQQRFSESVQEVHDHTGVLLLAEEYVKAVKSLFRSCPYVYMHFPETMDKRHVPQHARDAQVMTHALRQTHKMYFSEFDLASHDVQNESKLWQAICHKAITEATPFALRTMWVHAAQSLLFNLQASFVAAHLAECKHVNDKLAVILTRLKLRIPGFVHNTTITSDTNLANCDVCEVTEEKEQTEKENDAEGEQLEWYNTEVFTSIQENALTYALQQVRLNEVQVFGKQKVANVPFHAGWRHFLALPRDVQISVTTTEGNAQNANNINDNNVNIIATVSMYLPSSTYATIFLRELLNYDKWW